VVSQLEPDLPIATNSLSHRAERILLAFYLVSAAIVVVVLCTVPSLDNGPRVAALFAVGIPVSFLVLRRIPWQSSDQRGFAESVLVNILGVVGVWIEPKLWTAVLVLVALLAAANMATSGIRPTLIVLSISAFTLLVQARTLDIEVSRGALAALLAAPPILAGLESKRLVRQRRSYAVLYLRHGLVTGKLLGRSGTDEVVTTDINSAAQEMFETSRDEFVGRPLFTALPWLDHRDVVQAIADVRRGPTKQRPRLRLGDGRVFDIDVSGLPDQEVAFTFTDVTGQVSAEQTIREQAEIDALSGLANRSVLVTALDDRLSDDRRRVKPFALLMLDLNRFKEINDTFGHHVGDAALRQIAQQLQNAARPTDLVARVGGDEFAIIVDEPDGVTSAIEIATRFAMACEEPVHVAGMRVVTGASVGVVLAPEDGRDSETVMRRADAVMYEAKRAGERVRAFARADAHRDRDRLALSSQIDVAFAKSEFFMLAQPKVNLRSGRVTGFELLARWRHPERGLIEPEEFIDLVELAGRSAELARIALRVGIEGLGRIAKTDEPAHVALNLSPRDFADAALPAFIESLLIEHGVAPEQLFLEVTENQVFDQLEGVERFLETLVGLGVRLSIDDFGTGHSNLLRLNYLPVAEIKVDKYFVDRLITNPEDSVMMGSVIQLGHNLGLRVTAEGVQDPLQAATLRRLGCDDAQGFLWAEPLPVDEAIDLIGSTIG